MSAPRPFLPQETIRRKRDGAALDPAEIAAFVRGLTDGSVSEGQVAAFAMAVHFQGMSRAECVALTQAMTNSGTRLSWAALDLPGPVLDKHSTGGVGDKVSLALAPLLAACGGFVPMISGRGLGHTGGTLDKLESIPGYDVTPTTSVFREAVREAGCAIVGQTGELAPADDRFYAIRDVTATVDPIGLITASILSKKLAAGLDALVMDVKFGSGAFSADVGAATELAESIVTVATDAGLPTRALLTNMSGVLGRTAGNALEVEEAVAWLAGTDVTGLGEVVMALGSELLVMSSLTPRAEAEGVLAAARADGRAAEQFGRMVSALGGPGDLVEHPERHLPRAPVTRPVAASTPGVVSSMDVRAIGMAVVALGGGRRKPADRVDPRVGFSDVLAIGEETGPNRPLAFAHAGSEAAAEEAATALRAAVTVGSAAPRPERLVLAETVTA